MKTYTLVTKAQLIQNSGYIAHLESRLIDLYPGDAYVGVIADSDSLLLAAIAAAPTYVDTMEFVESDTIPTHNMEANILALDSTESILWHDYETLAQGFAQGNPADLEDILGVQGSGKAQLTLTQAIFSPIGIASGVTVAWTAFRVLQCANRAEDRADNYYKNLAGGETIRDAYRHITWQMLTRRYCGKTTAWFVGWAHEQKSGNNCASKNMDFHNNLIGRAKKYHQFRQVSSTNPWQWKKWCKNIHDYTEFYQNSIYVDGDWTQWDALNGTFSMIKTCSDIEDDRKTNFSKYRYIYIRP